MELGSPLAPSLDMPSITAVPVSRPVRIEVTGASLNGDVTVPEGAQGLVVFVHGSGSSRFSQRNRAVADCLLHAQLGTLLLDLLTEPEERTDAVTAEFRFDIPLLADRTTGVVDWMGVSPLLRSLPLGLFGASTGAAAALIAAADRSQLVRAVVSRGGRPDLAGPALDRVVAPTLLIVGGRDDAVLDLNREAHDRLRGVRGLQIVPGHASLRRAGGPGQGRPSRRRLVPQISSEVTWSQDVLRWRRRLTWLFRRSRSLRAQRNSPARIASAAKIVSQPGPGRAIIAMPAASRRKPPAILPYRRRTLTSV